MKRLTALVLLSLVSVGCLQKKPDPYPRQFTALMKEFEAESAKMASAPLPDPKKLTPEQRKKSVIEMIERDAAMHERFVARLESLSPSAEYARVHAAALDVFGIPAREGREWAEERRRGVRIKGRGNEISKAQIAAVSKMVAEIEKVAGKNPELRNRMAELRKMQGDLERSRAR